MLSLEVLHVEIAQKLQNLEFFLVITGFLVYFQFLPFFLDPWKKFSNNGSNVLEFIPTSGGT